MPLSRTPPPLISDGEQDASLTRADANHIGIPQKKVADPADHTSRIAESGSAGANEMELSDEEQLARADVRASRELAEVSVSAGAKSAGAKLYFPEASFLGIRVHAMTVPSFHGAITSAIQTGRKWLIAHHNLHSLYLVHKDVSESEAPGALQRFYKRAKWVQVDGMSMVLLARLHGYSIRRKHRIAHNVALPSVLRLAQLNQWRVLYLGSSEAVAIKGGYTLRAAYPGLDLRTHHGFFNEEQAGTENQAVLARIAAFRPHILFVGMGMPRQERWVEENFEAVQANVIITAGATLDYFAGALTIPPQWVGLVGLEWLYRLAHEPSRLAFRYLAEPCLLAGSLAKRRFRRIKTAEKSKGEFTPA